MRGSGNKLASSHLNFLLKSPTDMKVLKGRGGGDGGFSQVGCVGFTFKHMINYVDINKSDSPPKEARACQRGRKFNLGAISLCVLPFRWVVIEMC